MDDERMIRVGITHGDMNGVGYEVILKSLADDRITELCTPVIFGSAKVAQKCRAELNIEGFEFAPVASAAEAADGRVNLVDIDCDDAAIAPGRSTPESGSAAVKALEEAAVALEQGDIDVLVTAPICKETANSDNFRFPGHTEYLQERLGNGARSLMILFDSSIRVALVTTHLPLSKVAAAVTREAVVNTVKAFNSSLRRDFSIGRPRIAVLSLNPHCGDGGLLGDEELNEIIPAIEECCREGIMAFGPFAADGFFSSGAFNSYDGVVACYHDQGLAPFKALAGVAGVNFTAGLPIIRTSPDHGTAFDIAWKGVADPTSMREAIYRAIDIFRSREREDEASADPLKLQPLERSSRERPNRRERPSRDNADAQEEMEQPRGDARPEEDSRTADSDPQTSPLEESNEF